MSGPYTFRMVMSSCQIDPLTITSFFLLPLIILSILCGVNKSSFA
jgi:hypothetical protein